MYEPNAIFAALFIALSKRAFYPCYLSKYQFRVSVAFQNEQSIWKHLGIRVVLIWFCRIYVNIVEISDFWTNTLARFSVWTVFVTKKKKEKKYEESAKNIEMEVIESRKFSKDNFSVKISLGFSYFEVKIRLIRLWKFLSK